MAMGAESATGAEIYRLNEERKLIEAQRALQNTQQGIPITGGVVGSPESVEAGQTKGANVSSAVSGQQSTGTQRSDQFSSSYIPEYSQTPILEEIAKYSRSMAPQVYDWGMQQFNKNQGNIDQMMRSALSYASPQRIAANMGMAEAGVQQGAEAGRQSAIRDLQSYGIDPSSGRYASLDNASRIQSAASAAGAGNQQRMADTAQGGTMMNQAISSGLSNVQTGYGAANAANQLLGTASNLKYAPLGTVSGGSSSADNQSSGFSNSSGSGWNSSQAYAPDGSSGSGGSLGLPKSGAPGSAGWLNAESNGGFMSYAPLFKGFTGYAEGGEVDDEATEGGFVSNELSPSSGAQVDDVNARLNAGEFVIPKDVSEWMGQKFFYELMAKARKMRAMADSEHNGQPQVGYGAA